MSPPPIVGFRPETAIAVTAVSAGMRLASENASDHPVAIKDGRDVVTTADVAVETAIRALLTDALDLPSVGEEDGGTAPLDGSGYWLIDPICGTRNYASGIPLYCVNLALIEGGEVTIAVVGDPSCNDIFLAERGAGAWTLTGDDMRPMRASDNSKMIIVEEGKSSGQRRERAAKFAERLIRTDRWDTRSLGTTLSLPYVASGRVSAYACFDVTAIHGAAGVLLSSEAGATVSDIDGTTWSLDSDSVVAAATPDIHEELLALITDGAG